ncbi:PorP/SprF family type IX secretion system membrane protein [Pseudotenacibaculum haliotis]|uniref:Type IX secretion system membrane protein PorP/SprF n=1 Tax=Pseudotenacibaculum haliotis TaxID=1862138 RepID=A0ABW5LX10_9FLAO
MKLFKRLTFSIITLLFAANSSAQETLPIYSDYLSDNVYLVHPSAAGIGNTGKLRFTARQQWQGIKDAPTLQTLSFHNRFGEKAAFGFVLFNDSNGFHSQKGVQGTYAYHLDINRGAFINQLSFGVSLTAVQNQVDQTQFFGDPTVAQLIQSDSYFNADFSVAYHRSGFSSYFTVKNLLLSAKNNLNNNLEPLDLRNYILSFGYYFGQERLIQYEPSVMIQLRESTGERIVDFNLKAYKNFQDGRFWAALSYRRSFDAQPIENLTYITPIVGVNYKRWMFSYTYSKQLNDIVLTDAGFHQVSVGVNLFTRRPRASACPNINATF